MARAIHVTPDDDWPHVMAGLAPGDEVILAPGDYVGGWRLTRGGTPDAPIVIRSLDGDHPARILSSTSRSVIDIRADDITLRGLHLGPTPASVHAVVLSGVSRATVEECRFDDIGGLAVVQTMTGRALVVRGNHIRDRGPPRCTSDATEATAP